LSTRMSILLIDLWILSKTGTGRNKELQNTVSYYIKSYQAALNSLWTIFLMTCTLAPGSNQIIYNTHLWRDERARKQFDSYYSSAKIIMISSWPTTPLTGI
jgi:hypothetical protein